MTRQEYEWRINLERDRLQYLNLSFEQAEKLFRFQEDLDRYSSKYYFSTWEESDYHHDVFQQILDPEQFRLFEQHWNEGRQRQIQGMEELEAESAEQIIEMEQQLAFCEKQVLPDLHKDPVFMVLSRTQPEGLKIQYLKKEYARFLNDTRKRILSEHYRQYRRYRPNELKLCLLRHQHAYLLPDYLSFKGEMDASTQAIANYLKDRFRHFSGEQKALLARKLAEMKAFGKALYQKRVKHTPGWHVESKPLTEEEESELHLMMLLLLDRDKYSTEPVITDDLQTGDGTDQILRNDS